MHGQAGDLPVNDHACLHIFITANRVILMRTMLAFQTNSSQHGCLIVDFVAQRKLVGERCERNPVRNWPDRGPVCRRPDNNQKSIQAEIIQGMHRESGIDECFRQKGSYYRRELGDRL